MSTVTQATEPILVNGEWVTSAAQHSFQGANPSTSELNPSLYPVSPWEDCQLVLEAAAQAADQLRQMEPAAIAEFLELFAGELESQAPALIECAHRETALPVKPRLADVELPRTTAQLRQAAAAARNRSWAHATIDTKLGIRSCYEPIGPVCVFGPNNFPFAFNSVAGGDFAAAIAAGNPVIGKANTSHPGTTQLLAELALAALQKSELPFGYRANDLSYLT
jgi:2,5-dioxopentanoate dehydrogenase